VVVVVVAAAAGTRAAGDREWQPFAIAGEPREGKRPAAGVVAFLSPWMGEPRTCTAGKNK